ncbi:MAG: cytochrome c [Magnetococcales bacterium]|nr:cytochrome c [Magnetococcales bacterium]
MNRLSLSLIAGLGVVGAVFMASPVLAEPDPTSQAAWSGGMFSGEGTFQSYCMPCHGFEGKGDGMLSESLGVKPRDLTDVAFMSSKTDAHLFQVIKKGGASVGLTENMTPFEGQLSDQEIKNVVSYLRKSICKCEPAAN